MPKLGDGTNDAVNRVHDADQDPNYRKPKETNPADPAHARKFSWTLEQGGRKGDGSAEGKTDKLASELQKSVLARVGKADPSDLRMAPETANASKDTLREKDDLTDGPETDKDTDGKAEADISDLVASGDADPGTQQNQIDKLTPDPSHPQPEANPLMQQSQNDPTQSAQLAQMLHDQQSHGGFDKAGVLQDYRGSEAIHAAERLRETKRDAEKGDPADLQESAAAAQVTPIVQAVSDSGNEVSDVKEAERLHAKELEKLANKLMGDVSQVIVSMEGSGAKEVTVFLSPDVLPDTSFTVSFSNKGVEVKFQTKNGQVADKINDVRGDLKKRLSRSKGFEVTVPEVTVPVGTGGSDDLDPGV